MRAAKQGAFDALCGIYALINVLDQIGLKEPRGRFHQELFAELIGALSTTQIRAALTHGLTGRDLAHCARMAGDWLAERRGCRLTVAEPFGRLDIQSMPEFVNAVQAATSETTGVIVNLALASSRHWSVVRAASPRRLQLRDSGRLDSLDLRQFSLTSGPRRIWPRATLTVSLAASDTGAMLTKRSAQ